LSMLVLVLAGLTLRLAGAPGLLGAKVLSPL
jgi:hypothetical protein